MTYGAAAVGSPARLDRVFVRTVQGDLFDGHTPSTDAPVLVLLGGQPAAGKTRAQAAILAAHLADDLVEVTGDDLREYHPDYLALARDAPLEMPGATAPVSGGLVSRALDHALMHRFSVLLEGTFRDPDMVTATATRFAEAGYRVEVAAVATPGVVSRLSAEQRSLSGGYPKIGRWTPPAAHEAALDRSGAVVAALEALPHVARVEVFSRERSLYLNDRDDTGAWARPVEGAQMFRAEQTRILDDHETARWMADYADVFRKAAARPGYLGAATGPAYVKLQDDAQHIIHAYTVTPGASVARWRDEQRERYEQLRRVLPPGMLPTRRRTSGCVFHDAEADLAAS